MSNSQRLVGTYLLGLEPMLVSIADGEVLIRLGGVPGKSARRVESPDDFPFPHRVGRHDDGELIAAEEIGDIVMSKVRGARRIPGAVVVSIAWDEELAGVWDEYIATRKRFTPDVERTLSMQSGTMEVRGPEGFLQAYEASLFSSGIQVES